MDTLKYRPVCVAALRASVSGVVRCTEGVRPEEETRGTEVTQQAGNQLHIGINEEGLLL